ncbi:MAG TPA: sarcosine oxidase subunit gamma [Methylophilus sp.]
MQASDQDVVFQMHEQPAIAVTSPVALAQLSSEAQWDVVNGMRMAVAFADHGIEQARKQIAGVVDISCLSRFGVKGPQAARWLAERGVAIPASINSWTLCHQSSVVLRLGSSEFLIEDPLSGNVCQTLTQHSQREVGVYFVPRADAAFALCGSAVMNVLSELCPLDLREAVMPPHVVIMTQIAGISATVWRQQVNGEAVFRVVCDGTYGPDMWAMLVEIATELGGGAVGLACCHSALQA